jgi:hypothetical protein
VSEDFGGRAEQHRGAVVHERVDDAADNMGAVDGDGGRCVVMMVVVMMVVVLMVMLLLPVLLLMVLMVMLQLRGGVVVQVRQQIVHRHHGSHMLLRIVLHGIDGRFGGGSVVVGNDDGGGHARIEEWLLARTLAARRGRLR